MIRIYLSSPYEFSRAEQSWKKDASVALTTFDSRIKVVDPCPFDDTSSETLTIKALRDNEDWLGLSAFCNNIVEADLAMLNNCEGVVCYLPAKSQTVGSIHELVHAIQRHVPVVLVCPEGPSKVSSWLWGLLGPSRIFSDLELACTELAKRVQVARGEKQNGEIHYVGRSETDR